MKEVENMKHVAIIRLMNKLERVNEQLKDAKDPASIVNLTIKRTNLMLDLQEI